MFIDPRPPHQMNLPVESDDFAFTCKEGTTHGGCFAKRIPHAHFCAVHELRFIALFGYPSREMPELGDADGRNVLWIEMDRDDAP